MAARALAYRTRFRFYGFVSRVHYDDLVSLPNIFYAAFSEIA